FFLCIFDYSAVTSFPTRRSSDLLWPRDWSAMVVAGDPIWQAIWTMLLVHWLMVAVIGLVVYFLRVRGPLESLLRSASRVGARNRSEEHTSELQSRFDLVCRLLLG